MNEKLQRDPVEVLMDEFASRCRKGERPDIEEFVTRLPEREDDIREMFPTIALMEEMKSRSSEESQVRGEAQRHFVQLPQQLGNYKLLREIGRGGMGVVFEAVQNGLDRRVALKVMNSNAISSERQLRRFQREVHSVARLHHTNIVPVFAVGEDNSTHYYSMQFIEGISLDRYIGTIRANSNSHTDAYNGNLKTRSVHVDSEGTHSATGEFDALKDTQEFQLVQSHATHPLLDEKTEEIHAQATDFSTQKYTDTQYIRSVAQIGIQVANALQYAHEKGILHRDIKPQNLMLDRTQNVWITDFGLAKVLDEAEATQTGNIVGTLLYMAPEQLQGAATAQSDLYSLGLTLYELLSMKPAFANHSGKVTFAERMRQRDVPRLRTLNPNVPKDLETIIMKALQFDAPDRYESSEAFADDLENFLDGRTIDARRSSSMVRLWKWTRRNPALATAVASIIILLSGFATMANLGRMQVGRLLSRSQTSQKLAESRLDLATAAFDNILKTYSDQSVIEDASAEVEVELLGQEPSGEALDAPVTIADTHRLVPLLEFYEDLATSGNVGPDIIFKVATAKQTLGDIHLRLGRLEDSESTYLDAIQWIDDHVSSETPELVVLKSTILNELGKVALRIGDFSKVFAYHLDARANLLDPIESGEFEGFGQRADVRFEMARSGMLVTSMLTRSRFRFDLAPRSSSRSSQREGTKYRVAVYESLTPRQKHASPVDFSAPNKLFGPEIMRVTQEVTDEFEQLVTDDCCQAKYHLAHAESLRNKARMFQITRQYDSATISYSESKDILRKLVRLSNSKPSYVFHLAEGLAMSRIFSEPEVAVKDLKDGIQCCKQLTSRFPSNYEYQLMEAITRTDLAIIYQSQKKFLSAESELELAIQKMEDLKLKVPKQILLSVTRAQTRQILARLYRDPDFVIYSSQRELQLAINSLDEAMNDLCQDEIDMTDWLQNRIYQSICDDLLEANTDAGIEGSSGIVN